MTYPIVNIKGEGTLFTLTLCPPPAGITATCDCSLLVYPYQGFAIFDFI